MSDERSRMGDERARAGDDPVRDELRALPRVAASPGFTRRLLVRLDAEAALGTSSRAPRPSRLAWAGAAGALALALIVFGGLQLQRAHERRVAAAELAALKRQQLEISRELAHLREQSDALQPVVYIGGNDNADFVLDVGRLARAADSENIRPAGYRGAVPGR